MNISQLMRGYEPQRCCFELDDSGNVMDGTAIVHQIVDECKDDVLKEYQKAIECVGEKTAQDPNFLLELIADVYFRHYQKPKLTERDGNLLDKAIELRSEIVAKYPIDYLKRRSDLNLLGDLYFYAFNDRKDVKYYEKAKAIYSEAYPYIGARRDRLDSLEELKNTIKL